MDQTKNKQSINWLINPNSRYGLRTWKCDQSDDSTARNQMVSETIFTNVNNEQLTLSGFIIYLFIYS